MATTDTNCLTSSLEQAAQIIDYMEKNVSLNAIIKIKLSPVYLVAKALRVPVLYKPKITCIENSQLQ
jgi:hypothetical protein